MRLSRQTVQLDPIWQHETKFSNFKTKIVLQEMPINVMTYLKNVSVTLKTCNIETNLTLLSAKFSKESDISVRFSIRPNLH